jgi:type IV pilus assembly protein PilA
MLARIRKAQEKEGGFTLIELLVVMIIIGILAAIAIPLFLNQRKNAYDASLKSDVRTIANELESVYTDTQAYPAVAGFVGNTPPSVTVQAGDVVRTSAGNNFTYNLNAAADAFCIVGSNVKATHNWVYVSSQGGLQASTVLACPAAY